MRRVVSILIVLGILGGFARAYNARNTDFQPPLPERPVVQSPEEDEDTKMVDLAADIVYPYDLGHDSSVICLVGNFIGHHNGAVITCDSAVRYDDQRLECFGNVLINKNETYIYGDRADYNGATNRAEVYSPLVKVIDGDATLYTYRFRFDTKLNIGEFSEGGVITNRDNMLESDRGFYYADTREVIGVDQVEIRNESYQMKGDSVIYNIETDNARFFTNTNIWNEKGEYLYADRGDYDSNEERYIITSNGYILTETREVWSDSLDYYKEVGYALLRNDIQIDDTERKLLSFGDWGEYWDAEGNALLTREPAIISYDAEQGDSLFMRADTIWMHTHSTMRDREEAEAARLREAEEAAADKQKPAESSPAVETAQVDTVEETPLQPETSAPKAEEPTPEPGPVEDRRAAAPKRETSEQKKAAPVETVKVEPSVEKDGEVTAVQEIAAAPVEEPKPVQQEAVEAENDTPETPAVEDGEMPADEEISEDGEETEEGETPVSELSKEERKAKLREIAEQERAEKKKQAEAKKKAKQKELKIKLDSIAERRQAKRNIQLDKQAKRDSVANAKAKVREELRKQKMLERLKRKGIKLKPADAKTLAELDTMLAGEVSYWDSVAHAQLDSIISLWMPVMAADSAAVDSSQLDTVYRVVRGYRNVRLYRSDFQAVCDSLSSSTLDSVIRMYIEPVLWNQSNQITSEQMDIHTKEQKIDFAEFINKPMMISKIDTLHFNQVAGKTMYSYFRDNEIYRDDVDGNAQTIYYMQDDDTQEIQGMMYITSADMTFFIDNQEISQIIYRGNPDYVLYPMDKIPESQEYFLQGFTWQENRRPAQDSVFTRTIRPSLRAEKEALPRPMFPIASRIENFKSRLIEQNRWYDREETLTGDVIYWLDMNTDWREQNARDKEMREKQSRGRRSESPNIENSAHRDNAAPAKPEVAAPSVREVAPLEIAAPERAVETLPLHEPAEESLPEPEAAAAEPETPIVTEDQEPQPEAADAEVE